MGKIQNWVGLKSRSGLASLSPNQGNRSEGRKKEGNDTQCAGIRNEECSQGLCPAPGTLLRKGFQYFSRRKVTAINLLNVILGNQVSHLNPEPFHLQLWSAVISILNLFTYSSDLMGWEYPARDLDAPLKPLWNKIVMTTATKCKVILFSRLKIEFTTLIEFIEI